MNSSNEGKPKKKNSWYLKADAPPYVPKPKGTRWYAIEPMVTVLVLITPMYPIAMGIVDYENGKTAASELVQLNAKIIKTYRLNPHLLVQLEGGDIKSMELPVPITFGGRMSYGGWRENREANDIIGCDVQIKGAPIRWTIEDRFRVWELNCKSKGVILGGLDIEKIRLNSRLKDSFLMFLVIWLIGPVFILMYILVRERKSHG